MSYTKRINTLNFFEHGTSFLFAASEDSMAHIPRFHNTTYTNFAASLLLIYIKQADDESDI